MLLPGLVDAHVHLRGIADLEALAAHGVTTALDMACWPPDLVDSLRHRTGLTDIRSADTSATSPGSRHSRMPHFPAPGLVAGPPDAVGFVARRVREGSDYIKIIAMFRVPTRPRWMPSPPPPELAACSPWPTPRRGRPPRWPSTPVSASSPTVPLDEAVDDATAARMARESRIAVPTLTMMEAVAGAMGIGDAEARRRGGAAARRRVAALHRVTLEEHFADAAVSAASAPRARELSPDFPASNHPAKALSSYSPPVEVLRDLGDGLLADLDEHGITVQVLSCSTTQQLPAAVAPELVPPPRALAPPHVWLTRGDTTISTIDVSDGRFVLLSPDQAWVAAARRVADDLDLPLEALRVGGGDGADLGDPKGVFPEAFGVGADGAVISRADGHVAWRAVALTEQPGSAIRTALGAVLHRELVPPSA